MTDLKPFFNQVVEIVQEELNTQIHTVTPPKPEYQVSDAFHKETLQLYHHCVSLNEFLTLIKSNYLSIDDENGGLSIEDKNKLDEDFQIKLQALFNKLKVLQIYEEKRRSRHQPKISNGWFSDYFGDEQDDKSVYYLNLNTHRMQMLRFITNCLDTCNKNFQILQRQRAQRERQLHSLNFQNLDEDTNIDLSIDEDHLINADMDVPQLTATQVQEFELENKNILNLKTDQLKKVEKLHSSMVDIINMQKEITMQIEAQSDQIENLIDNQDQINLDLTSGNKNLNTATSRNKRAANAIIYGCIIMGILLLMLDYIR